MLSTGVRRCLNHGLDRCRKCNQITNEHAFCWWFGRIRHRLLCLSPVLVVRFVGTSHSSRWGCRSCWFGSWDILFLLPLFATLCLHPWSTGRCVRWRCCAGFLRRGWQVDSDGVFIIIFRDCFHERDGLPLFRGNDLTFEVAGCQCAFSLRSIHPRISCRGVVNTTQAGVMDWHPWNWCRRLRQRWCC